MSDFLSTRIRSALAALFARIGEEIGTTVSAVKKLSAAFVATLLNSSACNGGRVSAPTGTGVTTAAGTMTGSRAMSESAGCDSAGLESAAAGFAPAGVPAFAPGENGIRGSKLARDPCFAASLSASSLRAVTVSGVLSASARSAAGSRGRKLRLRGTPTEVRIGASPMALDAPGFASNSSDGSTRSCFNAQRMKIMFNATTITAPTMMSVHEVAPNMAASTENKAK